MALSGVADRTCSIPIMPLVSIESINMNCTETSKRGSTSHIGYFTESGPETEMTFLSLTIATLPHGSSLPHSYAVRSKCAAFCSSVKQPICLPYPFSAHFID